MRHYEILGSGAVPFFVFDSAALDQSPLSMYAFPRELPCSTRRAFAPACRSEHKSRQPRAKDGRRALNQPQRVCLSARILRDTRTAARAYR